MKNKIKIASTFLLICLLYPTWMQTKVALTTLSGPNKVTWQKETSHTLLGSPLICLLFSASLLCALTVQRAKATADTLWESR